MPEPEFFTRKVLAVVSCCWSGTAGLYRPGNLPSYRPNWNDYFHWLLSYLQSGKAGTLPSACWMWGRCPLAVAGSLLHDLLHAEWPSAHPGSPGAVELAAEFLFAALRACLLLLLRHFLGRVGERGAPEEPRVAMADASFSLVLRTYSHWKWGHGYDWGWLCKILIGWLCKPS